MQLRGTPSAPSSDPRLSRSVWILSIIAFAVAVGFGVMVPVLPVFAQQFDVGTFGASAVVSAFAFARLIGAPLVGPLVNRLGERPVLAAGLFFTAISTAISAVAGSYLEFLLWRGVGGVGSAMFTVSAMTLLLNTSPPQLLGRAGGLYQGGFLLGGMAGPAIGGGLAAISITAPFFFYSGAIMVAGLIAVVVLRSSGRHRERRDAGPERPFREVMGDSRFHAALVAGLAQGWNSFGVRNSLIPILVVSVLHHDPTWTGIAFTVSAIVQAIMLSPAGRFVDQVGRRPAMLWSGFVAAGAMVGVSLASNIWLLIIMLAIYGAAAAYLSTAPTAAVGDAAGGSGGTPVAVFSMVTDLGAILGPLVAGWLADHGSFPLGFGVGALLLVAGSVLALRMPPEVGARSTVPDSR